MRRFMVVPLAGLMVLTFAGPVAAAPNVHNTSGGGTSVYGEWSGDGLVGYVMLEQENGSEGWGEVFQESGTYVLCEGDPFLSEGGYQKIGPLDTTPGEEFYGFQGTRTWGFASGVSIEFSRRLEHGTASGQIELYTETIDECAGVFGGDPAIDQGTLDVTLTGEGVLGTFRGFGSYSVPSEFNGHSNYRGKERPASGSILAGTTIDAAFGYGYMSVLTWTEHTNS